MTRKATEQVAMTGIDIGENSLYLIRLEGCLGSKLPLSGVSQLRPESGVKQPKSVTTSAFGGKLPVAEGALGQLLVATERNRYAVV